MSEYLTFEAGSFSTKLPDMHGVDITRHSDEYKITATYFAHIINLFLENYKFGYLKHTTWDVLQENEDHTARTTCG